MQTVSPTSKTAQATAVAAGMTVLLFGGICLSGPVRSAFLLTMSVSLVTGFALALAPTLAVFNLVRRSQTPGLTAAASIAFTAYAAGRLYFRPFGGLVSVGGGDAGNHVEFIRRFATSSPEIYQGFTSFFSTVFWLQSALQLDVFAGFKTVFLLEIAILSTIFAAAAAGIAREAGAERKITSHFWTALIVLALLPAERIALPILHYLQADGFYPQLFGLLPLGAAALVYAATVGQKLGWAAFSAVLVWYRYAYGLNLAELLVTYSLVNFCVPRSTSDWGKLTCSVGALGAAFYCLYELFQIIGMQGAAAAIGIVASSAGLILIAVGLSCTLLFSSKSQTAAQPFTDALYRFAAIFSATSGVIALIGVAVLGPQYYLLKYGFHAAIVATAAAVLVGAEIAATFAAGRPRYGPISAAAILFAIFGGLYLLNCGYRPLIPSYRQRTDQIADSALLFPLNDTAAEEIIANQLNQHGKIFGGVIVPEWSMSNFLNAKLGRWGEFSVFRGAELKLDIGYCVFYRSDKFARDEYSRLRLSAVVKKIASLDTDPALVSVGYTNRETNREMELSFVCK